MTAINNMFDQNENRPSRRREDVDSAVANGWSAGSQNLHWRSQLQDFWTLSKAQTAITWIMLAALIAMAAVFLLVQASAVATVGREIQELQYSLNTIRQVNSDLERQIAEAQAIEMMQSRASILGFHKATPDEAIYIVVPGYPAVPAPFDPFPHAEIVDDSESVNNLTEALKLSLYQTISGFIEGSAD
ncbi:MAG: cell division protein FtsL [Cellvibrionaceae bacterium]|jgi:cell division protein FtsL